MVQGSSQLYGTNNVQNWENKSSKKPGYENIQKMEQEKKSSQKSGGSGTSHGAWGPTFKNKDHFVNMHHS